jgi:DNA (cytosine-5)-methyltransferase 1
VKTIPVELVQGVSDTTAHEILGQSVIFAAFEALGVAVGGKVVGMMQCGSVAA